MKQFLLATLLILGWSVVEAAKTCKDFSTQAEAQSYHDKLKKSDKTGWKSLDRDGDGRACDCLPGGSGKNCPKSKK